MSFLVRHKVRGLDDWLHLKYPEVQSKLTSFGLFVWHRGDLRIVNLTNYDVARVLSSASRVINFIETFESHCYVVSHNGSSSVVQSFNISSISILTYSSPRDRVISIEHISPYSYVCGTDSNQVHWVENNTRIASYKVFETGSVHVLSMKHFEYSNDVLVACGLSNGQVKIVNREGPKDALPHMEDTGKVVSIELISYNNKNFFVLLSESPVVFKAIAYTDEQTDYYEHYSTGFEGSPSLLEMRCLEGSCVFLLMLNGGVLSLYTYTGGNDLELVYQSEMDIRELRDVLCFCLPELSLFHTPKEDGCDLCMVINAGSEIQTIQVTSSKLEKIAAEISDNCTDSSIWQKPDLLNKVIREFSEMDEVAHIGSEYHEEDFKIIDILVGLEKSSLICDFILREAADNYLLQDEYVLIVADWVRNQVDSRKRALFENVIASVFVGEEESGCLERYMKSFLECEKIQIAIAKRNQVEAGSNETSQLVFICKVLIWLRNKELLDTLDKFDWSLHRNRLSSLLEQHPDLNGNISLNLDLLINPQEREKPRYLSSISKTDIVSFLQVFSQEQFCRILLYLLFELEHTSLESKALVSSFISEFFVSPVEVHYVRGLWCLDTTLHPKVVPTDNRNLFDMYSADSLYELAKVTQMLDNAEKLHLLKFYHLILAVEQAVQWLLVGGLDWDERQTVECAANVIFSQAGGINLEFQFVRAYAIITLIQDEVRDPGFFLKIFAQKVMELGKAHKLANVSFEGRLQMKFLDNLPDSLETQFFTFLNNHQVSKAFSQGLSMSDDFMVLTSQLSNCFQFKRDDPKEFTFLDYKGDVDEYMLKNLTISDSNISRHQKPLH